MTLNISHTITADSTQVNNVDLVSGPVTVTITGVEVKDTDQPVNIRTDAYPDRDYRPSKSMRRVMARAWGEDAQKWIGQSLTLYRDPKVRFGGIEVGGIKISAMTGLTKSLEIALPVSRGRFEAVKISPLANPQPAPVPAATSDTEPAVERLQTETDLDALRAMWQAATPAQKTLIEQRAKQLEQESTDQ